MIQEFLRTVPLFRELDDEELAQILMVSLVKRFPEGTAILTEGEPGGWLHVIHQGEIRISKVVPGAGEEALTIIRPGDFIGEIGFFDGGPASAHAIAHTDCEVLSIPHREVESLVRSRPALAAKFFWAFGRTLAVRLRETNEKMAGLLAISLEPGREGLFPPARPKSPPASGGDAPDAPARPNESSSRSED
ncbi:MAG TPA: cyclic nucleotide-binding domain-containing protein [Vicinamibacteria bacterium]|nr:cyclic nucleotide-binding domain-containing protein [Vicinamibacteria bacterium]